MQGIPKMGAIYRPIPHKALSRLSPAFSNSSKDVPSTWRSSNIPIDHTIEDSIIKRVNRLIISQLPQPKVGKVSRHSYPPYKDPQAPERPANPMNNDSGFVSERMGKQRAPELCVEECKKKYEMEQELEYSFEE